MTRTMRDVALLLLVNAVLYSGCQCQDSDVLATVNEKEGAVDRDFVNKAEQWQAAKVGDTFRLGDGVRSKANATALLALSEGSMLKLTPNSQIRFLMMTTKQGKSGQGIDVETGEAELLVGEDALSLFTTVGMATIASGSRLKLKKVDEGISFEVEIGKATYFDKNNIATEVSAGQGITVDIGAAVLEKFIVAAAETQAETVPQAEEEATEPAEDSDVMDSEPEDDAENAEDNDEKREGSGHGGGPVTIPDGPAKADFKVSAGDSFVVHAPVLPIAVAFDTRSRCPSGAAIQIGRRWSAKGPDPVRAVFKAGKHRYRIKCLNEDGSLGDDVGKGHIMVLLDAGVAKIPGNPPASFIETDGRTYRIMYQTRPPSISVKWPKAPKGQKYKLHIDGKKSIATSKPQHTLSSGTLSEGAHQLNFEAIGSLARTSRTTTLEIRFDNAAPKASLTAPANGSFTAGSTVEVAGTAMSNWDVELLGGTIEKDAQLRFKGQTKYNGSYMSVTLRLSHARRGVHYYIRRASGQGL